MVKEIIFCFFVVLLFVHQSPLIAQRKIDRIKLENISGSSTGSESESIAVIRERAIADAKVEALKEAGISESISSYSDFFQSESREEFEELFTSDIFTSIRGSVTDVEVVSEQKEFTGEGFPKVGVVINCTVIKYNTTEDRAFEFEVNGIESFYKHNDLLTYSVKPYKPGYLRGFVFTGQDAYQIFPNRYEESFLLEPGSTYEFPQKVDITLETKQDQEVHRAVFVFLKEDIPYLGKVTYKEIFDWIFSIPPDKRNIKSFGFTVVGGVGE